MSICIRLKVILTKLEFEMATTFEKSTQLQKTVQEIETLFKQTLLGPKVRRRTFKTSTKLFLAL